MSRKLVLAIFLAGSCFILSAQNQLAQSIKSLDFLQGSWKVSVNTRLSMQGPWETTEAISSFKKILNEKLIEEDYKGLREGKPFLTKTLFAVNNMDGKLQRVFIDSEHGVLVDFEGEKIHDSILFDRTWTYSNGTSVKLRVKYKIISNDEFEMESMRMPEGKTDWDVTERLKYVRKK